MGWGGLAFAQDVDYGCEANERPDSFYEQETPLALYHGYYGQDTGADQIQDGIKQARRAHQFGLARAIGG